MSKSMTIHFWTSQKIVSGQSIVNMIRRYRFELFVAKNRPKLSIKDVSFDWLTSRFSSLSFCTLN